MNRTQKEETVAELKGALSAAASIVVLHQTGLDAAQTTDLRRKMREAGATYRVTKNRLTRRALDGTPYEGLAELFKGPTAVAYSKDPMAPAKVVVEFARGAENKIVILGGALGATRLDGAGVKGLAALPSLDQLRGRIAGLLRAPATKLAVMLQAPASKLARVVQAYAQSGKTE